MEINYVAGYQSEVRDAEGKVVTNEQGQAYTELMFVFSHKDKKNWSLFKVRANDIPFLKDAAQQAQQASEQPAVEPEVIVPPVA